MTHLDEAQTVFLGFTKKFAFYESGALIGLAAIPSYTMTEVLEEVFRGVPLNDLFLPVIIGALSMFIYGLVFTFDFFTGLKASSYEVKEKGGIFRPSSSKLWSSVWKILAINTLIFTQMVFAEAFALMKISWLHTAFMVGMLLISIAASLFDLISIGENYERRFGKKQKIFTLLEDISKAFNQGIIQKIGSLFK